MKTFKQHINESKTVEKRSAEHQWDTPVTVLHLNDKGQPGHDDYKYQKMTDGASAGQYMLYYKGVPTLQRKKVSEIVDHAKKHFEIRKRNDFSSKKYEESGTIPDYKK